MLICNQYKNQTTNYQPIKNRYLVLFASGFSSFPKFKTLEKFNDNEYTDIG
jgi:hypothetical protein